MAKRDAQSTGTVNRATVEKKGFKRAEAAIYLGVTTVSIDRLTKRGFYTHHEPCDTQFIPKTTSTAF